MKSSEIINFISGYKYVSFDMFDTLILRNVSRPQDIFSVIERDISKKGLGTYNFSEMRIAAEKKAINNRKPDCQEITIDDIYSNLSLFDEETNQRVKNIEKNIEIEYCTVNLDFVDVLRYCKDKNITVIVTTDMYLDKETIKSMLGKCGINYDFLFLSSEKKLRKSRGSLFKCVLNELNISNSEIVHIGDNRKSDYLVPKTLGIKSFHYRKKLYSDASSIEESIINAVSLNYINKNDTDNYYRNEGYRAFGPLLMGFSQWLHENIARQGYDQILFLSRDGYIMQKAYKSLYVNEESQYAYFSRRSLTVPQLVKASSFQDIIDIVAYIKREENVKTFLHKVGLDDEQLADSLRNIYGDTIIREKLLANEYNGLYEKIIDKIKKNAILERTMMEGYLKQVITGKNIAIVDIGWYGTMQHNLEKVIKSLELNVNIHGYYLGYLDGRYGCLNADGYIFDEKNNNSAADRKLLFGYNGLIETFFTANHGSVKKYDENSGSYFPVFEQWEKNNWQVVSAIHDGAIAFIENINSLHFIDKSISPFIAWKTMESMLLNPDDDQLEKFGKLQFYDTYVEQLNKYQGLKNYIKNPNQIKNDLLLSNWKIGFLKSMFRGIISPESLYRFIIKIRG